MMAMLRIAWAEVALLTLEVGPVLSAAEDKACGEIGRLYQDNAVQGIEGHSALRNGWLRRTEATLSGACGDGVEAASSCGYWPEPAGSGAALDASNAARSAVSICHCFGFFWYHAGSLRLA